MASNVQICNRALIRLGADTITSLTENSKEARLCNILFDVVRKDLLRAHPWNFSIKRTSVAYSTTEPEFEFDYQYALPSDCLRVLNVHMNISNFSIEGGYLYTNDDAVDLIYIADITDTEAFDSAFTTMMSLKLAAELCYNITGNTTLVGALIDEYEKVRRESRLWDGQEGSAPTLTVYGWLDARD